MKNNMKKRLLAVLMALFGICSCTVVCYSTPINKVAQNQLQGQCIECNDPLGYNEELHIVVLEINKDTIIILVNKDIIEIKKILSL